MRIFMGDHHTDIKQELKHLLAGNGGEIVQKGVNGLAGCQIVQ